MINESTNLHNLPLISLVDAVEGNPLLRVAEQGVAEIGARLKKHME